MPHIEKRGVVAGGDLEKRRKALPRVLRAIADLPVNLAFYGTALAAIAAIAGTSVADPGLSVLVTGVGINVLSNMLERVARGELTDEDIRNCVRQVLAENDIATQLTVTKNQRLLARLFRRLDILQTLIAGELYELASEITKQSMRFETFASELGKELLLLQKLVDGLPTREQMDERFDRLADLIPGRGVLSPDLLAKVGQDSLVAYARQEFGFLPPDQWVRRKVDTEIARGTEEPTCALTLLVGEPGFGKSAAAYTCLSTHIDGGGFGLCVPASIAQDSVTLNDMIRQTLDRYHGDLPLEEVAQIPHILPSGSRFIILVDDVNRMASPPDLVRKLVQWATDPFLVLCPIWPRFRTQLVNLEHRREVRFLQIDRMHPEEASQAIRMIAEGAGVQVSQLEAGSIAASLGYDPFLMGVLGSLVKAMGPGQSLDILAAEAMTQCIQRRIGEASQRSDGRFTHFELEDSLVQAALCMLRQRNLQPRWTEMVCWLGETSNSTNALRDLQHHGDLCRVSAEDEFRFVHDRFLHYFCVEALKRCLNDFEANSETLCDPAYAEWVAQALLHTQGERALLDAVQAHNPLALVSAIMYMGPPSTDYHYSIIRRVKEWLGANVRPYSSRLPESLSWEIAATFIATDSPAVLDIVDTDLGIHDRPWIAGFARFRNGDPRGAVEYCSHFGPYGGLDDYVFKPLVEHAALHHRELLVKGLADILRGPQGKHDTRGAPILAGFLGFPEFSGPLRDWWRTVDGTTDQLANALWAVLRCTDDPHDDAFLDDLIADWAVEESRAYIGDRLGKALAPYVNDELLGFLVQQAQVHGELRFPLAILCGKINLPDAVEFVLRTYASEAHSEESYRHIGCFLDTDNHQSQSSVNRLRELWADTSNSDQLRALAFSDWLRNAAASHTDVIQVLRSVQPGDVLFTEAILNRARLGDRSCVSDLAPLLESDTSLLSIAHHVWTPDLYTVVDKHLEQCQDVPPDFSGGWEHHHYELSYLLINIPRADATRLLCKHWNHLQYAPLFIHSALWVGTPLCLELAGRAVAKCPPQIDLFRHFDLPPGVRDDIEVIRTIGQYWERFDSQLLGRFAIACYEFGDEGQAWCQEHLSEEINRRCRQRCCPTDDDLIEMLDQRVGASMGTLDVWLRNLMERVEPSKIMTIVSKWLESETSFERIRLALCCIEKIGRRQDLEMLDHAMEHVEARWLLEQQAESVRFSVRRRTLN